MFIAAQKTAQKMVVKWDQSYASSNTFLNLHVGHVLGTPAPTTERSGLGGYLFPQEVTRSDRPDRIVTIWGVRGDLVGTVAGWGLGQLLSNPPVVPLQP